MNQKCKSDDRHAADDIKGIVHPDMDSRKPYDDGTLSGNGIAQPMVTVVSIWK